MLDTIESNTDILKTQEEEREEEAEVSGKLVSDLIQEEIDRYKEEEGEGKRAKMRQEEC